MRIRKTKLSKQLAHKLKETNDDCGSDFPRQSEITNDYDGIILCENYDV